MTDPPGTLTCTRCGQPLPAPRSREGDGDDARVDEHPDLHAWKTLAAVAMGVAALTGLGYAVWAMTIRRGIFAAIADGRAPGGGAVSLPDAQSSDALNAGWLWATTVLTVAALALWFAARVVARFRFGLVGFTGVVMVVIGVLVVVAGSYVSSLVGGAPAEAGKAVIGYSLIGGGFVLLSLGLLVGLVGLFREESGERMPQLGYAGWTSS